MDNKTHCVYLTIYFGNKLPIFYIGSSTTQKILKGYRGSVSSKMYKNTWNKELIDNPHLFKTKILSIHSDDKSAREKEKHFQLKLNVVKNPLYTNLAIANINGFFGMDVSGKNNPNFGNKFSEETKQKISNSKLGIDPWNKGKIGVYSKKTLEKLSESKKGKNHPNFGKNRTPETKQKMSQSHLGKKRNSETIKKMSEYMKSLSKIECEVCKKVVDPLNYKKWHSNNCRNLVNG